MIVCPGGGYRNLASNHEGRQVAGYLNSLVIAAFVLRYRLGPRYHHPIELGDAQRAIRCFAPAPKMAPRPRTHGVIGFSAGPLPERQHAVRPGNPARTVVGAAGADASRSWSGHLDDGTVDASWSKTNPAMRPTVARRPSGELAVTRTRPRRSFSNQRRPHRSPRTASLLLALQKPSAGRNARL
jgi:hypothetical protein